MSPGKNLFVWVTAKSRALLIRDGQLESYGGQVKYKKIFVKRKILWKNSCKGKVSLQIETYLWSSILSKVTTRNMFVSKG